MKDFTLSVLPAIPIEIMYKLEAVLKSEGYRIHHTGADADGSISTIYFILDEDEEE